MKTCLKLIHVVRTRSDLSAARFPSPRPSPSGRGGNAPSDLAKPRLNSAPRLTNDNKAVNGCPLSPRARVRVRGTQQTYGFQCSRQPNQSAKEPHEH